jgi:hypothetical protein
MEKVPFRGAADGANHCLTFLETHLSSFSVSGDVVTMDCVEKIIKPDMVHPLTGVKLGAGDLIELQRGGTGYAAANESLKASSYRPGLAIN